MSSPLHQNRAERASTNRAARAVELDEPVGVSSHQRGTESSNPSSSSSESAANPTSVSLRDWAIVTPRLPAEAAEAADRHLYFS